MNSGVYTQYATRLGSGLSFLLHSIIYDSPNVNTLKPETYNFLGVVRSAGCIRYTSGDSKWIFDHCALGTTVRFTIPPSPAHMTGLPLSSPSQRTSTGIPRIRLQWQP